MKMNPNEKEIIKRLRQGKRVNISAIARELKMPVSTVADNVRKIESQYVTKRASLLDYAKLGYYSHHLAAIKIDPKKKAELLGFLREQPCVNSIYSINSDLSFMVELVCKNHLEFFTWLEDTKSKFPLEISSFQILNVDEREKFVP